MIIREMTESDIKSVAQIEQLSFSHPWSEKDIASSFNSECNKFYISAEENKITGYIGFCVAADEGYILNVAVRPDFRKNGIGKALVQKILDLACTLKLAFVTLEVRPSNEIAVALYTSLGFQKVGVRKDYYKSPNENALLLTKTLRTSSTNNSEKE